MSPSWGRVPPEDVPDHRIFDCGAGPVVASEEPSVDPDATGGSSRIVRVEAGRGVKGHLLALYHNEGIERIVYVRTKVL